jgi:Mn2+/Fe2+ NRAMP family transporter
MIAAGAPVPSDPYALNGGATRPPPPSLLTAVRRIGPGLVLASAIVGSGELIATTTLGAQVGYAALWIVS